VDFEFEDQSHDGIYRFDEEDCIPPPAYAKMMENLSSVNLEPQFQADINEIQQEEEKAQEAEADAQNVQPPPKPAEINNERKRRWQRKSDEDFTVIPPGVFHTWLQYTSDIVKDHNHREH
jgi:hypothetical protein